MIKIIKYSLCLILTTFVLSSFADLSTGLVGHWTFNEGSGSTVSDTSGNGHHATIYGYLDTGSVGDSIWVDGYSGSGIRYKAYDTNFTYWQIRVPYDEQIDIKLEKTLSAWVYYYKHPSTDWKGCNIIAMKHSSKACYTEPNFYSLDLHTTAGAAEDIIRATYSAKCGHGTTSFHTCQTDTSQSLDTANWHHVAVTHSSDSTARIFIDGVQLVEEAGVYPSSSDDSLNLFLGIMESWQQFDFDGDIVIDEIRLYNRALSHSEIAELAENEDADDRQNDSLALVALYDSTGGDDWTNHTNWKTCEPINTWYGVTVSDDRVTSLSLSNNNLGGVIPSEIGDITNLRLLYLHRNQLSGSIPASIGNLSSLVYLYLNHNYLTGTIPSEISKLSSLVRLHLHSYNSLTGSIPASLGDISSLQHLTLSGNQLSDTIPSSLGNLSNLKDLWIDNNNLTGSIPTEIGDLSNLKTIWLHNNQIDGEVPSELGNLSSLIHLYLSNNEFSGVGDSLVNLTGLTNFFINNNKVCTVSAEIDAWLDGLQSGWETSQTCP